MRKLVVTFFVLGTLAVLAACGAGESASPASSNQSRGTALSNNAGSTSGTTGAPSTGTGAPDQSATGGGTLPVDNVPALQGPPVIRQAQLSISVSSGSFDSKLSEVRTLVEGQGGYIAGTDAQAGPATDTQTSQIRTGVINFMVPAANFDATIDALSHVGKLQN